MNRTSIEWTNLTVNPLKYRRINDNKMVWACVKTSPGCGHCYAETIALRFDRGRLFNARNMEELRPFLDEDELRKMLTAKTVQGVPVSGSRCFVGDMTDLFGEWVPDKLLDRLFAVFALRPDVTWQVLSKRPERMRAYIGNQETAYRVQTETRQIMHDRGRGNYMAPVFLWPLECVWLGVSVEDQPRADERIPLLLQCPAAVRFLSCEPLLEPVDLSAYISPLEPVGWHCPTVNWVILGGESGPHARSCRLEWVRDLVRQCQAAGTACFVKQLGDFAVAQTREDLSQIGSGCCSLLGHKGADPQKWPEDLRVREFPEGGV